jgi:Family of unknown function (DUF6171)
MKPPSFPKKVVNFAHAAVQHVVTGMKAASPEELQRRMAICLVCEYYKDNQCMKCGCDVPKKAAWNEQKCPIGKWDNKQSLIRESTMAANNIPVLRNKPLGGQLIQLQAHLQMAANLVNQLAGQSAAMANGSDYSQVEAQFGVPNGAGTVVNAMLQGLKVEMGASINVQNVLTLLN